MLGLVLAVLAAAAPLVQAHAVLVDQSPATGASLATPPREIRLRFNEAVNAERQAWVSEALGRPGEKAADAVADLVASLGLPGTLRDVGVKPEQLDRIAEESMHDRWVHTNPRKIAGPADVRALLDAAW